MGNRGRAGVYLVVAVLVAATVLSIWLRRRELDPKPVILPAPAVKEAALPESSEAPNGGAAAEPSGLAAQPEPAVDSAFKQWISQEAKELDKVHHDGEVKKRQMQAVVAKMTGAQSRQLLQTVKNPKAPAGEKILSTFLLVEGGERTQKELTDLITSPLEEDPNYAPHSEEEMKGIREKSLRIMAIDGLFSRARVEPGAREALARAARETPDPTLRAYAEDKLKQLQ